MKFKLENRTSLPGAFVADILWQAVGLVFSSAPSCRRMRDVNIIVKPLRKCCAPNANPSGCAFVQDRKVILRIDENWRNYPAMYCQDAHPEWPGIKLQNAGEALLTVACHEFSHLVLPRNLGHKFEEWLCENIAVTGLLISRGVVKSKLL